MLLQHNMSIAQQLILVPIYNTKCMSTRVLLPLMWLPVGAMMRHQHATRADINTRLTLIYMQSIELQ